MFDVIIVGGGPAGLSAALALARLRRKVLICDKGEPRNAASRGLHGFLTRDGIDPREFLRIARDELLRYRNVEFLECEVVGAERRSGDFLVRSDAALVFEGRMLLLATGLVDELPRLEGIERFYGRSVHHCPYCDGWEHRDQPLAVFGDAHDGVELALKVRAWSDRVIFCPDDASRIGASELEKLRVGRVGYKTGTIERLEGEGDSLNTIAFRDGSKLPCSALFIVPRQRHRTALAEYLGCRLAGNGQIECGADQATSVDGVFAIGNATPGLQLVIIAAAEGTKAAFAIDEALQKADARRRREQDAAE